MCGIAGIVRFDDRPIDRDRVRAIVSHLHHRGPDGEGVSEHPRCTLIHRRLSIIDLLSGQQPMHLAAADASPDVSSRHHGDLHLVFNGEIYNHRALRAKLERRGHVFTSDHSDTEVLLLGYRQWGENLPKHLHGMFAFAIWDEKDRRLFVARDRAGKKPLYLRFSHDHRELSFASLPSTLMAGSASADKPGINEAALLNYLRLGYTFGQSLIDGINELPAAHFMRVEADGQLEVRRYWRAPPISKHSTMMGAVDALEEVLSEAVATRLEADVPLGCFLSGGIDSSVIAAIAQRRLTELGGESLHTYSVAMPDVLYDESKHAMAVAKHIGATHTVLQTEISDAIADLQRLMAVAGEPTADSSILPTHWLCKAARPFCKAALSGDGGDELFGGYDRYRAMGLIQRHGGWLQALPGQLFRGAHAKSRRKKLSRLAQAARIGQEPSRQYHAMIYLFSDREIVELMPDRFEGKLDPAGMATLPDWEPWADLAHAAMRWDFQHYLPFELLRKVDRASMAVALEVRCPLLDTQVCDLAGHLPTSVLMPQRRPKALLRQVASRYLPPAIVARKKMGFAVPLATWLRKELRDDLADHLFNGQLESLGVHMPTVRAYFDQHDSATADHSHRLFSLLQLSLWDHWRHQTPLPTPPVYLN